MNQPAGAVCEIDNCGIAAFRRCANCGRAFCRSHQAHGRSILVDQCTQCGALEDANRSKKLEEEAVAEEFFRSGAARAALRSSGVQPAEIQLHKSRLGKGRFGIGYHWVDEVIPVRGWILGEVWWCYSRRDGSYVSGEPRTSAVLDESQTLDGLAPEGGLVGLPPHSRAEECLALAPKYQAGPHLYTGGSWVTLLQAVRRLTGSSS
jgi:hypothetical protein